MMTSIVAGFAAATMPLHAEPIHTDGNRIVSGQVFVPVKSEKIPAYQAHPVGAGPFPVVLVVQEIFGVHEYIQDVVRRFAKQGFFAIAPELYARQGDPSTVTSIPELIGGIVTRVPDEQVMKDLDATLAYVGTTGLVDINKAVITGFCWGGRIVWLYSARNPALKAGVAWYGMLGTPPWAPQGVQVLSLANSLKIPVLGLYGGLDANIPMGQVNMMREKLKGTSSEIVVYENADHGFHADYRPGYNHTAAQDGWFRLLQWFALHGVKGNPVL